MSSTGAESEEKSAVCRCVADDKERRDLSQLESLGQLAPRSRALVGDVGGGIMNRGDWKRNGVEPWTTQVLFLEKLQSISNNMFFLASVLSPHAHAEYIYIYKYIHIYTFILLLYYE
tara:strand:+ start:1027 stop:1377 length:351 start_codon:yes stop_codon:yes gene_type:complete